MHRFFIQPSWVQGNEVTITGLQARQMARVLRLRPGDRVIVLDNSGWELEVRLSSVDQPLVKGDVLHRRLAGREPRTKVSLYLGVLRSNRFEFALQKGTELGVVQFVPIITDRCVVSDLESAEKKRGRWEWIIQEAAEQCRRGRKPTLRPAILFARACEEARQVGGLSLILWEEEQRLSMRTLLREAPPGREKAWPPFTINLFIGPEGGFTVEEIAIARRYDVVPVTIGSRTLRSETAAIAASAAVLYELGDMA